MRRRADGMKAFAEPTLSPISTKHALNPVEVPYRLLHSRQRMPSVVSSRIYVSGEDHYRIVAELAGGSDTVLVGGGAHRSASVDGLSRSLRDGVPPSRSQTCTEPCVRQWLHWLEER